MTDPGINTTMRLLVLLTILFCSLSVAACGIKPGSVEAPEDGQPNVFPQTYPDLNTDPQPAHRRY